MSDDKKLSPNTVVQDAYDKFMFKNLQSASADVKKLTGARAEDINLASDVFASFYKMAPELEANSPQPQRELVEALHKLPEFEAARGFTRFDEVASTLATLQFAPTLLSKVREVRNAQEKKQAQQKGQGQPGDGEPGDQPGVPGGPGGDQDGDSGMFDEETMQSFRAAAREALDRAADQAEKWHGVVNAFGFDPGEIARLPTEKKLQLAEQLLRDPSIHRIASLVGRFKNLSFGAQAMTPTHGSDEIVDVGQGSEISRMLPSEMLKYSRLRPLFYKDLLEGALSVYNMRGTDYMGLGPLVKLVDVSGSMAGEREEWAKAVTLAFIQIAEKQKRPVAVITFEAHVVSTWLFPRGQRVSLEEKLEILSLSSNGGGTNYKAALDKAIAFIKQEGGKDFKPSDISIVTDGEYEFAPAALKQLLENKRELSVRVFGINVAGASAAIDRSLSKFCDAVFTIDDLGEVSQARGALVGVMKREERKDKKGKSA